VSPHACITMIASMIYISLQDRIFDWRKACIFCKWMSPSWFDLPVPNLPRAQLTRTHQPTTETPEAFEQWKSLPTHHHLRVMVMRPPDALHNQGIRLISLLHMTTKVKSKGQILSFFRSDRYLSWKDPKQAKGHTVLCPCIEEWLTVESLFLRKVKVEN
jgi:hypothetical protein